MRIRIPTRAAASRISRPFSAPGVRERIVKVHVNMEPSRRRVGREVVRRFRPTQALVPSLSCSGSRRCDAGIRNDLLCSTSLSGEPDGGAIVADHYTRELGFDLGWDLARYGRPFDRSQANEDVLAGYATGRAHFEVPQHTANRYQAKWLQLRFSAIRRRRIVRADVTPEYLQLIDCETCPVTLEQLTHSTRTGTDWSVDRINNDGAYASGNLMVIGTRANRAKRAKNYRQVAPLANATGSEIIDGLTPAEWARLACLMIGAENIPDAQPTLTPLLTRIPEDCRVPLYYLFQQFLLASVARAATRNHLIKTLNGLHPDHAQRERLRLAAERLAILRKNCDVRLRCPG